MLSKCWSLLSSTASNDIFYLTIRLILLMLLFSLWSRRFFGYKMLLMIDVDSWMILYMTFRTHHFSFNPLFLLILMMEIHSLRSSSFKRFASRFTCISLMPSSRWSRDFVFRWNWLNKLQLLFFTNSNCKLRFKYICQLLHLWWLLF